MSGKWRLDATPLEDEKQREAQINADEKLKEIFGKAQVSMFEMSKYIKQHLK